jgi:mannosyl-oligosaccharide alpha-1,2-mannosidase
LPPSTWWCAQTIESFYILYRTTGEAKWRDKGWEIFENIERLCKTPYGYASIRNVDEETVGQLDEMPSYFLAET